MAEYHVAAFVEEEKVPLSRRGGPGNPEIQAITAQLIEAHEDGNTNYAFIPVDDKLKRKYLGESIRNQAKARGYNIEKVAGTRTRRLKGGRSEEQMGLFVRVSRSLVEESALKTPRRRSNGVV